MSLKYYQTGIYMALLWNAIYIDFLSAENIKYAE